MKHFLLALLLIGSAAAQTFTKTKGRYRADFHECQLNHSRIYDVAQTQTEKQIETFSDDFEEYALSKDQREWQTHRYRVLFTQLLVKKVTLQKLKAEFNQRSLAEYIQSENVRREKLSQRDPNYRMLPFMNYENLELELEKALKKEVSGFSMNRPSIVGQYFALTVSWQFTKTILTSTFTLFYKIGAGLFAHLSASALKSIALNIGSQLFVNAAKGTLITLLVDPFLGARLPPETEWTDLLEDYPELIIFPEWMLKAKVGDGFAWQTHCQALTTRTSFMERRLENYLKKDQKDFERELKNVGLEVSIQTNEQIIRRQTLNPADNTRVNRPPLPRN